MELAQLYELFKHSGGITTDSRKIEKGQIYFALKGDYFNGNAFAEKAIDSGAAYAIIDEPQFNVNDKCIVTDDVLTTLQQLAYYHRKLTNPRAIIAITGSNGKTTTKELIHAVLSTTYKTHCTKGNLNNHIGIPLTLLAMKPDTEIAVIEMGANHKKEIKGYCRYTEPTHGIITNCGKAHLEGFGSIHGVREGKGELYDYLERNNGTVFINGDDAILQEMLNERKIKDLISYGNKTSNTYNSKIVTEHPVLEIQFEGISIQSHLFGSYNYSNIMCAVAVGKYFGVEALNIKDAIKNYFPDNARSQVVEKNGYRLILDAYNANPTSMQSALESFAGNNSKKKIVILGDMYELGEDAGKEHQFIADLCTLLHFDSIVLVGKDFNATRTPDSVLKFTDATAAQTWFRQQDLNDAEILLKGSRSMAMEKVVE